MSQERHRFSASPARSAIIVLALAAPFSQAQDPAPAPSLADARDLFMQGAYDSATEAYQQLAKDPKNALPAGLGIARGRMQVGQYEEALAGLSSPSAATDADARHLLAELHVRTGKYAEAEENLREGLKINPRHAASRLALGQLHEYLGRRDEAIDDYAWFDQQIRERRDLPKDPGWITDVALGFYRYSVLTGTDVPRRTEHVLNEMLQPVYARLDRGYWPARVAAGDLLRQKFNNDEQDGSVSDYNAALRINPHLPEAHVGLGEVALENWGFELVEAKADEALRINPNFSPALHLLARKLILERKYAAANEACERALKINSHDLAAMSISAAASACRYDAAAVEAMKARVAAINPRCALFHRTLGDALGGIRQYEASEREYKKAIELDPTDANARTELGMMYMQWGPEDKARDALDAAWALDAYNQRTKFTLDLLDRLHKFSRVETEHFVVRHDEASDPGLGEYAASYLEPIYRAVTEDFETPLSQKTVIEFFPTHRSFGVRITGKPWIHTVGASTGWVIAMASPRQSVDLMGSYNFARVLKHEFTHTVTLAATENRIPHWFTEGLAVYEEDAPKPFDWCQGLADLVRRDRLFTLESIDWGFIRPRRPIDRQLAYAQSEWMVEFLIERFGYDAILAMIRRFRGAETQARVFAEQFHWRPEEFDEQFRKWARSQIKTWPCPFDLAPPPSLKELRAEAGQDGATAATWGRLARAEFDEQDCERALAAARRALEIDPSELQALWVLAQTLCVLADGADEPGARRTYEDEALLVLGPLLKTTPDDWTLHRLVGEIALRRKDRDAAFPSLQKLQQLCPLDPMSWGGLAAIHLKDGDEDKALPQLIELARLEHNDHTIPAKAGMIFWRRGETREAQYWLRQALATNPFNVPAHQALADVCSQLAEHEAALREYVMLTKLEPQNTKHFESAALTAQKLGDATRTRDFARQAVQLDPNSAVRSLAEN